jgi:hypothetical protein
MAPTDAGAVQFTRTVLASTTVATATAAAGGPRGTMAAGAVAVKAPQSPIKSMCSSHLPIAFSA